MMIRCHCLKYPANSNALHICLSPVKTETITLPSGQKAKQQRQNNPRTSRNLRTCPNDYRPVTLTPVIMKRFERVILKYMKDTIPAGLDSLQFAYRENISTGYVAYTVLTHLQHPNVYVKMLFVALSSAFNTIPVRDQQGW